MIALKEIPHMQKQQEQGDEDEKKRMALLALLHRTQQSAPRPMNITEQSVRTNQSHHMELDIPPMRRSSLNDVDYNQAYQTVTLQERQRQLQLVQLRHLSSMDSRRNFASNVLNPSADPLLQMLSSNNQSRDMNVELQRLLDEATMQRNVRLRDTIRLLDASAGGSVRNQFSNSLDMNSFPGNRVGHPNVVSQLDTLSRALAASSVGRNDNLIGTAAATYPPSSAVPSSAMAQRIIASSLSRNSDARLNPTSAQHRERFAAPEVLVGYNPTGFVSVDRSTAVDHSNKYDLSPRKRKSNPREEEEEKKPAALKRRDNRVRLSISDIPQEATMFPLPNPVATGRAPDSRRQYAKLSSYRKKWNKVGEKFSPETQKEWFLRHLSRGI